MKLKRKLGRDLRKLFLTVQRPFFEEVLVLGDSHAAVFGYPLLRRKLWRYHLNVISVGGATASGLENPNSQTQAYRKFEKAIATTRAKTVIVMLGEVDTGFVIWYRAAKYGVSVQGALAKTLETYEHFLSNIQACGLSPVCVSTPLPTIQDGNRSEVARKRREVSATQRERTELTLEFNRKMESFCVDKGITYLNLDGVSLGKNGIVKRSLLNENLLDHHYEKRAFATLLCQPLNRAVRAASLTNRAPFIADRLKGRTGIKG